jgi:hypothetical protein
MNMPFNQSASASLSDILTAQKNGVIAINNLAGYTNSVSGFLDRIAAFLESTGVPGPLGQAAASTSFATLYTCPADAVAQVTDITICNTSASPATFSVCIVPSGGTAGASNAMFFDAPIPGNTTVQWTGSQFMTAGGFLSGKASATTVAFTIGGRVAA